MANNNNNKTLNVPNLRFPEFSGEWKKCSLGNVTDFIKERISSDKLSFTNYVSTENMRSDFGGINPAISIPNNTNVIHYQKGDVLLSNIRPYLRKVWSANYGGGCSADVFVFRAKHITSSFLHYVMANDTFINYVMSGAKGVKMPRGDKEQMLKYIFSAPSNKEQEKISHLLHLLDERIATQNKIIEKLQSLILGIANQVCNSKVGNTLIKDCLDCHTSTIQESSVLEGGLYPVYGASGIAGYTNDYQVDEEAILIIKDGSGVGKVSYVEGKFSVIGTLNYLTAKESYSLRYLYYCLMAFNFKSYKTGMAIPHIYFKDYSKASVYCPKIENQEKVSETLSKIEEKLNIEKNFFAQLNEEKTYLLQKMFI